jgi:hypothetical protein
MLIVASEVETAHPMLTGKFQWSEATYMVLIVIMTPSDAIKLSGIL